MEDLRLHHSSVHEQVLSILNKEEFIISENFAKNLLSILSRLCNYEEEGQKIKPRIILAKNIDEAIKTVPNSYMFKMREGQLDGSDMEKFIKSLIPFCNSGWHVFINIRKEIIDYGIARAFSGPIGLAIAENILNIEDFNLIDYSLIEIKAISNFELSLCGVRKNNLLIDSRYIEHESERDTMFPKMIEDITLNISEEYKDNLKKALNNLFRLIPYKTHGTVCLVVDSDYQHSDFLSDGIWFEEPIDLAARLIDVLLNEKDIISAESYYGLSGLFLEMLNIDGITVIDNKARIRGYNIFIRKEPPKGVVIPNEGGARKRAANTALLSKEENLLGVYFLSQDGNSFYKRVGE